MYDTAIGTKEETHQSQTNRKPQSSQIKESKRHSKEITKAL